MITGQLSGVDNPDLFPSVCAGHFTLDHFCNASGDHQSSYLTYNLILQMLQTLHSQYLSVGYLPEEAVIPLLYV